jgi:dihydroorotate dehydrogenase (fumarate)
LANLQTSYMGLTLKNPVVPSASPLSRELDGIRAMEDAGAAAIVLYSLFEEQIALETGEVPDRLFSGALGIADATLHFPQRQEYPRNPDDYVEHLRKAKESVGIPIIASMNGTSKGGWLDYAHRLEQAGADGLELNIYFIPTTDTLMGMDIETVYVDILRAVKKSVKIPVAVKLSPFFSAIPNMAMQLDQAGASALVLFNRFYQPDIDVPSQQIRSVLSLSRSEDILLPLRWIAILHGQVECGLALTGGVNSADDVLKAVLAGADVAQVASVLLREGMGKLRQIVRDLETRMDELGMESITAIRGKLSLQSHVEPAAFERSSYIKLLQSFHRI